MRTNTYRQMLFFVVISLSATLFANAQGKSNNLWTEISDVSLRQETVERTVVPNKYRTLNLNKTAMQAMLLDAPQEFSELAKFTQTIISLPMPDGTFSRFRVEHSLVAEPGLIEKYPELGQTYRGRGIDDPTATVRLDFLPTGFHSMVLSTKGTVMIDPYSKNDTDNYVTYYKRDVPKTSSFSCDFDELNAVQQLFTIGKDAHRELIPDAASPEVISGTQLRTYRLALAATNEYASAVGGNTVAGTLAAQVLIMNRVNGVYERDVALRMVMVANNNLIIYAGDNTSCGGVACTSANDPYTNSNGSTMLGQNQTNLDTVIGTANYDMGHVFSTGGGGVATLNSPCAGTKARGVTGLPNPVGDPFAIDFVAHEMGHQWGAPHTFNGGSGNCAGGNRSAGSAYEPGSGVTIMAYAGICGNQDLANNSIDTFHVKSLNDIVNYSQTGNGASCGIAAATGNTPPTVAVVGGPTFNIPKQTPFTLTAAGSDVNGDTVTYDWQQFDLGSQTSGVPNTDGDGVARPIFRVYLPTSDPSRSFPTAQYIRTGANVPPATTGGGFLTGEILPQIARTMNFQVVARDNRAGGGGINSAAATVVVDGNGPFAVTGPNTNTVWNVGQTRTITWSVANTSQAPVNVANVKISLSTDGGLTFPTVIAASTPNDGSFDYAVPALDAGQARIKIEAIGNIFFDMSDVNFTLSSVPATNGVLAGRVVNAAGNGVPRVTVLLSGPNSRRAITNSFGYYVFDAVPYASGYTVIPQPRKGVTFSPASIVHNHVSDITSLIFTSN